MDIIYVLVPLSLALLGIAVLIFFWAVKGGQFDDLDSPAHRILFDDDDHLKKPEDNKSPATANEDNSKDNSKDDSKDDPQAGQSPASDDDQGSSH